MHKKIVTSVVGWGLVFSVCLTGITLANPKLSGHWAESAIEQGFMERHFTGLAENDFAAFLPDENISERDFKLGMDSILKEWGVERKESEEKTEKVLTRWEAAIIVADELLNNGIVVERENLSVPFQDLQDLSQEQINKIMLLNNLGIMKGDPQNHFAPHDKLTQAQAIIILQRTKNIIESTGHIPFTIIDEKVEYSSAEEGVSVEEKEDTVIVKIVQALAHPGYAAKVKSIRKNNGINEIYLEIQEPDPEKFYNQVITYHTIILEIAKKDLGKAPYSFEIVTLDKLTDTDWKVDPRVVKVIELYSLDGEKIKDFPLDEIYRIVEALNNSKVDERPYIEMITGNTMEIKMSHITIRFTSYGSETNVVATLEKIDGTSTKHLYCPEIAKILLDATF